MQLVTIEQAREDAQTTTTDGIERHADGRPKIYSVHEECGGTGKVPSTKREGKFIKCQPCKGTGWKGTYYTRTTTFIDVLEDKSNLAKWQARSTAIGFLKDDSLVNKFRALEDPTGADKSRADMLCKLAQKAADTDLKALQGTALHEITEDIDAGKDPGFIPDDYAKDIEAYRIATQDIEVVGIETFAVLDEFQVGGTFDRLIRVYGELAEALGVEPGTLLIADIKTGRIDYGFGKIAMQLAGYSRMKVYDPKTHERLPLEHNGQPVNQEVGLVIHMPTGQGRCELVPVDIAKGWEGLGLADVVRGWRKHWNRVENSAKPIRSVDLCK